MSDKFKDVKFDRKLNITSWVSPFRTFLTRAIEV